MRYISVQPIHVKSIRHTILQDVFAAIIVERTLASFALRVNLGHTEHTASGVHTSRRSHERLPASITLNVLVYDGRHGEATDEFITWSDERVIRRTICRLLFTASSC